MPPGRYVHWWRMFDIPKRVKRSKRAKSDPITGYHEKLSVRNMTDYYINELRGIDEGNRASDALPPGVCALLRRAGVLKKQGWRNTLSVDWDQVNYYLNGLMLVA